MKRLRIPPRQLAIAVAAVAAVAGGATAYGVKAWAGAENASIDARFDVRGAARPRGIVVVAIDDKTFSQLREQWPFPRRQDGKVVERLSAAGASAIVYDVQFTEPTDPRDDLALYHAIGRSKAPVVLATTEVNAAGETDVLGGEANLQRVHAVAAAANLPADGDGVIRSYPDSLLGLSSLPVATAAAVGRPISASRFSHDSALIDFRGPPGTIRSVSFSEVLAGRFSRQTFAHKIVVVGATAATLQDLHATSTTSSNPMAGPEIQANAIWTALHQNPLRASPPSLALLAIVLLGVLAPLASMRLRMLGATLLALAAAAVYLLLSQVAFDSGLVLSVTYPLAALTLGAVGTLIAGYVGAFVDRNAFAERLRRSQLELIQRLAQAVDTRDMETGEHVQRMGRLSSQIALQLGWSRADAEILRHAAAMHDIGKLGISDEVLLKPGPLTPEEFEIVKSHTTAGARILADSDNPLVQMAREIALCHHERWDGQGYPSRLVGEEIPLAARICAVADVYDALISKRSYKECWTIEQALAEIERCSGTHFDPEVVAAFLALAPQLANEHGPLFEQARVIMPHPAHLAH